MLNFCLFNKIFLMEIYFQHISFRFKMPKVNKKIIVVESDSSSTEDESSIVAKTAVADKKEYVSPKMNSDEWSLYESSNDKFCDINGTPFCPDCPPGLVLSTMVNKNGLFVCCDKHRVAIAERAALVIKSDNYIDKAYIFPICDKCNRSLMNITKNPLSKFFGRIFFGCSCPGAVLKNGQVAEVGGMYVMACKLTGINKNEKIDKITNSFSVKYIEQQGKPPATKYNVNKPAVSKPIYSKKI